MTSQTSDNDSLDDDDSLRNDILRGAEKIGRFVGRKTRDAYYGLESGHIPGFKEGGVWTSTKTLASADITTRRPTYPKPAPNRSSRTPLRQKLFTPPVIRAELSDTTAAEAPTPRPPRAARSAPPAPSRRAAPPQHHVQHPFRDKPYGGTHDHK